MRRRFERGAECEDGSQTRCATSQSGVFVRYFSRCCLFVREVGVVILFVRRQVFFEQILVQMLVRSPRLCDAPDSSFLCLGIVTSGGHPFTHLQFPAYNTPWLTLT